MPEKRYLGITVLEAARQRIAWTFDTFPRIYVSFSGGKDSTVMLHLVMDEAIRRGRTVGVMFIDFEAQYRHSIEHVLAMYELYADHIDPYWVALPIHLRNAVSMYEHHWICWEPGREADWVRQPDPMSITNTEFFPFYRYAMEFEEFVPAFGEWYGQGQLTACFVGIRAAESLNRWRTISGHGIKFEGRNWTNNVGGALWNIYPIYDWAAEDDWRYLGKYNLPYNRIYDLMHRAGLSIHQQRLCQPYGDDQRKGLWLFHVLEPETWARVVARVNGANQGALYARQSGNILGNLKITRPEGHTWESFAMMLLDSMPKKTSEHYKDKIATFIHWWHMHGYADGIPDEADPKEEAACRAPSWRRVCRALLRNDYWCKGLSFSQTKSEWFKRYRQIMQQRRTRWNIFPSSD